MSTWAITCYFNARRSRRRYTNYQYFSQALNTPLLTVEWSVDGNYDLGKLDATLGYKISAHLGCEVSYTPEIYGENTAAGATYTFAITYF